MQTQFSCTYIVFTECRWLRVDRNQPLRQCYLQGERIPTVTDGPFGSRRRQRATRIRGSDSNRVRIQNCMTQVKRQRLWLKAKFYFTTVIYRYTHIRVKVSSLAKLHSQVKVLKFRHNQLSRLYITNLSLSFQSKISNLIYNLVQPNRLTFSNQKVRYVDQHVRLLSFGNSSRLAVFFNTAIQSQYWVPIVVDRTLSRK